MGDVMYCKKCGSLIKYQRRRVPECCNVCGAKFEMIFDLGMVIHVIITMVLIIPIVFLLKKIITNEDIIFVVGAILMLKIYNIIERFLLKFGIIQYTNLSFAEDEEGMK